MARQADGAATTRRTTSSARSRAAARPEPRRLPEHAHLVLAELRAYRQELRDEADRVAYWRRILQGRLDLLTRTGSDRPDVDRYGSVLEGAPALSARESLASTVPVAGEQPLPDMAELWATEVSPGDVAAYEEAVRRLTEAAARLSAYGEAVARRLDGATGELIARYREDPGQCLAVLPLDPDTAPSLAL